MKAPPPTSQCTWKKTENIQEGATLDLLTRPASLVGVTPSPCLLYSFANSPLCQHPNLHPEMFEQIKTLKKYVVNMSMCELHFSNCLGMGLF